ncbi:MAG: Hsp20/alpha crystallin family protein [Zestosphaera sp.]
MVEEGRKEMPEGNRDLGAFEHAGRHLTQEPLIEVREYSDHVKILVEVSDNDPHSLIVRRINTSKIELLFKYRGRNVRKLIMLPGPVKANSYEAKIKNGVAKLNIPKG